MKIIDAENVEVKKVVQFKCGHCGHNNCEPYTLENALTNNTKCMRDIISCDKCGKDNRVTQKLKEEK